MVGALYAALTAALAPLSYGLVQFRFAEALCLLPFYAPGTVWGLFVGCLLANLLSPAGLPDIIVGSLATLLAVLTVRKIKRRWLAPLPVVVFNALMVGAVLSFYAMDIFGEPVAYAAAALSVGFGQLVVCYGLGLPLLYILPRVPYFRQLTMNNEQ